MKMKFTTSLFLNVPPTVLPLLVVMAQVRLFVFIYSRKRISETKLSPSIVQCAMIIIRNLHHMKILLLGMKLEARDISTFVINEFCRPTDIITVTTILVSKCRWFSEHSGQYSLKIVSPIWKVYLKFLT